MEIDAISFFVEFSVSNQTHGTINIYYPFNDESWWGEIVGNYNSIAVNAKNYLPMSQSAGYTGFSVVLSIRLDNGKLYAF